MPFEIEEITKTIKKNPVPWAIGLGVAVIGGYLVYRRSSGTSGYVTEAYPTEPLQPDEIATGPGQPGDISDAQLQELLAQLEQARYEDINTLAAQQQSFLQGLASVMDRYVSQQVQQTPQEPIPQADLELQHMVETIQKTPTIIFSPQGTSYTQEQVGVMYNWAIEENTAISRGYAGTSKNPSGLATSGMTVTYYPTGQVAFTPKGQKPPATPKESTIQTEIQRRGQEASQKLVSTTGKTGTIEQQLAGMSQQEKLSALRKVGLIQ